MTLKDIDLEIKKGEFTIIIGKVGSGKTSLINAIVGEMLHVPEEEIYFAGGLDQKKSRTELDAMEAALFDLKVKNHMIPTCSRWRTSRVKSSIAILLQRCGSLQIEFACPSLNFS